MKPGKFWFSQVISLCMFLQLFIWIRHDVMVVIMETAIVSNSIFFTTATPPSRRERIISAAVGCVLLVLSIPELWARSIAFFPFLALLALIVLSTVMLRRRPAAQTPLST